MKFSKSLFFATLLASSSFANAAAEFTVIQRAAASLSDTAASRLVNFTLPFGPFIFPNRSTSIANSAVLDLEVAGSQFDFNEVYINPPTTVCTSNATDANQAGSIGMLDEHDDANLRLEWATNHIAFSSGLLKLGANQLLICIRSLTGGAGPGIGNLDNISVKSIVLHYHTTP